MEQIKALIEKAKTDKDIMAKLDALGSKDAGTDEIITLAKEYGFTVTADEIEKFKGNEKNTGELKEEELEVVAGGGSANRYDSTCKNMTRTKYNCVGFMMKCWCDHYNRKHDPDTEKSGPKCYYWHWCAMKAYPKYYGFFNGDPYPKN